MAEVNVRRRGMGDPERGSTRDRDTKKGGPEAILQPAFFMDAWATAQNPT